MFIYYMSDNWDFKRRPLLNNEKEVVFIFLSICRKGNRGSQKLNNFLRANLSVNHSYYRNVNLNFTVFWDSFSFLSCLESFKNIFWSYPFCHLYTLESIFIYFFILEYRLSVLHTHTWNFPVKNSLWVESLCWFYSRAYNFCCPDFLKYVIAWDFSLLCSSLAGSLYFLCLIFIPPKKLLQNMSFPPITIWCC